MTTSAPTLVPDIMNEAAERALSDALNSLLSSEEFLHKVWPAAYDKFVRNQDEHNLEVDSVEIVVLPLDRIGAPAGASGASVFVTYFCMREDSPDATILPSPPLVIKLGSHSKLKDEIDFLEDWPSLEESVRSQFAMPLELYKYNKRLSVLVAPFRSNYAPSRDGLRNGVELIDLWGLLHYKFELKSGWEDTYRTIDKVLRSALSAVDTVHRNNRSKYRRERVRITSSLDWYLRNTQDKRSHVPESLFGDREGIEMFGRSWPNPSRVFEQIETRSTEITATVGPVHGDLHPKNIVLTTNENVNIIDFGWARGNIPVVVDYLLLDINLRSTTLPSQHSNEAIMSLASYMNPSQDVSSVDSALRQRAELIRDALWTPIKSNEIIRDWHREYILPMFLLAYGLLVHLDSTRNQAALVATVLQSSKLVNEHVLD